MAVYCHPDTVKEACKDYNAASKRAEEFAIVGQRTFAAFVECLAGVSEQNGLDIIQTQVQAKRKKLVDKARVARRDWILAAKAACRKETRKRKLDEAWSVIDSELEERERNEAKPWADVLRELDERAAELTQPASGYQTPPATTALRIHGGVGCIPLSELLAVPRTRLIRPGNGQVLAAQTDPLNVVLATFAPTVPSSPADAD